MPDLNAIILQLSSAKDAVAALSATVLLKSAKLLLAEHSKVRDGLLLAGELPIRELEKLTPDLVNISCDDQFHGECCRLLGKLPFDAGAEIVVPEVFRVLRKSSSDYWVVWLQAKLLHHLGYHQALRHLVLMTEETADTDWQMVGEWIQRDLLSIASSEASQ